MLGPAVNLFLQAAILATGAQPYETAHKQAQAKGQ
jgi:hypothetical protein